MRSTGVIGVTVLALFAWLGAQSAHGQGGSTIKVIEAPKPPPPPPPPPAPPVEDDDPKHRPGASPDGGVEDPTQSPPSSGAAPSAPAPPAPARNPGIIQIGGANEPPLPPPPSPPRGVQVPPPSPGGQPSLVNGIRSVDVPKDAPPIGQGATVVGIGERIAEIKVSENTRTLSNTIEYVSGLKVGMIVSEKLLEDARTRLYSTGLFKDVVLTWEAPSEKLRGQGVRIVVSAKDKFPWVIAPIFSYQARNYGGGLAYAHNNVLGRGIKFLLYGDYTTAEKMLLGVWLDPSINNSPFYYRIDVLLRRDSVVEYAAGRLGDPRVSRVTDVDTVGAGAQIGVVIARRFHIDVRLKLYYDWVRTPECFNTVNQDFSGTPDVVAAQGGYCRAPSSSGWDNTITTSIGWDGRSKVNGVQKGLQLSATWQYGATWLGDNWNYHLLNFAGVYAFRFFREHNLILRAGGNVDFDPPFKHEVEAGSLDYTLRGSVYRQFRGDSSAHATVEYIAPLFKIKGLAVRAIGFFDTNLTWFRNLPEQDTPDARLIQYGNGFRNYLPDSPSGVVRQSWNNGIGVGIRMYLRGVVLPLIGFDVAYGIEPNTVRYYLAIGSVLD